MADGEIDGDVVLPEFITRHGIHIPRKTGTWESSSAWVKVNEQDRIVAAGEKDQSALAYMVGQGYLDEHHGYYGRVFTDLRRYFLRRVDYAGNPIYAHEFFSTSNTGILETLYVRVCREIASKRTVRAIEFACTADTTPGVAHLAHKHRKDYRDAFDALVKAVDAARKWAREDERLTEDL